MSYLKNVLKTRSLMSSQIQSLLYRALPRVIPYTYVKLILNSYGILERAINPLKSIPDFGILQLCWTILAVKGEACCTWKGYKTLLFGLSLITWGTAFTYDEEIFQVSSLTVNCDLDLGSLWRHFQPRLIVHNNVWGGLNPLVHPSSLVISLRLWNLDFL